MKRSGNAPLTAVAALSIVLVAVLPILGCASNAREREDASASPSGSGVPDWRGEAARVQSALSSLVMAGKAWTFEPRGDVPKDKAGIGNTLVCALVTGAAKDGGALTFDAVHLYLGRFANVEAERSGEAPPPNPIRVVNRYEHEQRLPLSEDCTLVTYYTTGPAANEMLPFASVTPSDFARGVRDGFRGRLYWLVVDDDGTVSAIVNVYTP